MMEILILQFGCGLKREDHNEISPTWIWMRVQQYEKYWSSFYRPRFCAPAAFLARVVVAGGSNEDIDHRWIWRTSQMLTSSGYYHI